MFQEYKWTRFKADTENLIKVMNSIITDYQHQGFKLTVRQLYYQLVARGHIENSEHSYKRTTGIVNDARMAGLMDWDAIEDRTREFIKRPRWDSGSDVLDTAAKMFHMDMWVNQKVRVFVIVEKEALEGVLESVCRKWDVPLLAARGYPSGTVLREFAVEEMIPAYQKDQASVIFHLGDHDPSGIDMTRDLEERIKVFAETEDFLLRRIALTMDQIQEQRPPPNPAKKFDPRFRSYFRDYGKESWELDALSPTYISKLVEKFIRKICDAKKWKERSEEIEEIRSRLTTIAEEFDN